MSEVEEKKHKGKGKWGSSDLFDPLWRAHLTNRGEFPGYDEVRREVRLWRHTLLHLYLDLLVEDRSLQGRFWHRDTPQSSGNNSISPYLVSDALLALADRGNIQEICEYAHIDVDWYYRVTKRVFDDTISRIKHVPENKKHFIADWRALYVAIWGAA